MRLLPLTALLSLLPLFASASPANGLRFEKTVLRGVLLRAGGAGGQHSLSNEIVQNLCEEGVSTVFYLYPTVNFPNRGSHSCSRGTLEYKGGSFSQKGVRGILAEVKNTAENGGGPIVVHCWNGWHATGEVAAYALMQFCDWSGDRAADYWAANIADTRNIGKYQSLLKRIRSFAPFADLRLAESVKSRICP